STHHLAMLLGLLAALAGVVTSFEADTQPGPTIVLIALAAFGLTATVRAVVGMVRQRRSSASHPVPSA
ncbi:MAG: metal ABC transporter permease, partial [Actinomycetales bacterium]